MRLEDAAQRSPQIGGKRRIYLDRLAIARPAKAEKSGVQELAIKIVDHPAVGSVASDRRSKGREVHTDLVRSAGLGLG
jgi:hypothetical protein